MSKITEACGKKAKRGSGCMKNMYVDVLYIYKQQMQIVYKKVKDRGRCSRCTNKENKKKYFDRSPKTGRFFSYQEREGIWWAGQDLGREQRRGGNGTMFQLPNSLANRKPRRQERFCPFDWCIR